MNNQMPTKDYWIKEKALSEKQLSYCHEYHDGFDSEDEYDREVERLQDYICYCDDNIAALVNN